MTGCFMPIITGGLAGIVLAVEQETGYNGFSGSSYLDVLGIFGIYYLSKLMPEKPSIINNPSYIKPSDRLAQNVFEFVIMSVSSAIGYAISKPLIKYFIN
ncbi:MAG: hypothetical protein QXE31_02425 [Candidatus Woesearchaeota archaeon]